VTIVVNLAGKVLCPTEVQPKEQPYSLTSEQEGQMKQSQQFCRQNNKGLYELIHDSSARIPYPQFFGAVSSIRGSLTRSYYGIVSYLKKWSESSQFSIIGMFLNLETIFLFRETSY
jgi:hypothetical protein